MIDGAHVPGQIDLNLTNLGADIYVGACHKWLCAPKGAAFLYAHKDISSSLDPLVVSWGYESENPTESQFIDYHEWQGTRDLAAFLSVPAAIQFQEQHYWGQQRLRCHQLANHSRQEINSLLDEEPLCSNEKFHQMFTVRLPLRTDAARIKGTAI